MKEVKLETGIVLVHKNIDGVIRVSLKKKENGMDIYRYSFT